MPQHKRRFSDKLTEISYALLIGTFFVADKALAQVGDIPAGPSGFSTFVGDAIILVQAVALVGCTLSFVRVGMKFNEGDPNAMQSLRNTAIGTGIVAGAAAILQWVKTFFPALS